MSTLRLARKLALLAMLALAAHGFTATASYTQSLTCRKSGNYCLGGCTACVNHVKSCCRFRIICPCVLGGCCSVCVSVRVSC